MKRLLLLVAIFGALIVTGALLAQSIVISGGHRLTRFQAYDPKTPPPLSLPDAYSLALGRLAEFPGATNHFHCISASCIEMSCTNGWTGWTFWFSNTNGDRASMEGFFEGGVSSDVHSAEVFAK